MAPRSLPLGSGLLGAVICLSRLASAQAPPAAPVPVPPEPVDPVLGPYHRPPPEPDSTPAAVAERERRDTRLRHDGFYFRFAGGLGAGSDSFEADGGQFQDDAGDPVTSDASGFCGATEVAIGATPLPGLVIGGGAYTVIWTAPEAAVYDVGATYEFAASQLVLFGPFADWYVWPKNGWHVQGALGLASFVMGQGVPHAPPGAVPVVRAHTSLGYGLMLGAGYEWFVADQWSVGLLARMTRGWTHGSTPDGVDLAHDVAGYSVLLSITYH